MRDWVEVILAFAVGMMLCAIAGMWPLVWTLGLFLAALGVAELMCIRIFGFTITKYFRYQDSKKKWIAIAGVALWGAILIYHLVR